MITTEARILLGTEKVCLVFMQFKVERKKFVKALSFCQSVIEKKTAIPVLSHFMMRAEQQRLSILGTDLDLVISEEMSAEIQKEGSLCLPSLTTYDIVKRLDRHDYLTFSQEEGQLYLRCGKSEFRLSTLPSDLFPDVSQLPLDVTFPLNPEILKQLIDDTKLCMSDEPTQPILTSLYLHTDDEKNFVCAATDLHRLAVARMASEQPVELPEGLIVGRKAVHEIRKIIDDKNVLSVTFGASSSRIQCDVATDEMKIMFSARLIDGVYPKYQKAFDNPHPLQTTFDRDALEKALDRIAVVVDHKLNAVTFDFGTNAVTLSAENQDTGSGKEVIDIDYTGEPVSIRFNVHYILGIIKQMHAEKIDFSLRNAYESVLLKPQDSQNPMYIVMPIVA